MAFDGNRFSRGISHGVDLSRPRADDAVVQRNCRGYTMDGPSAACLNNYWVGASENTRTVEDGKMSSGSEGGKTQSLSVDDFFYFFLQLRKPRIRTVVERVRKLHPEMTREQLAQRLIDSSANLSLLGGTLLGMPLMLPGLHSFLRYLGLFAGSAVITRMHLYLILEIACLYDKDIDDPARVPEMIAVVAATETAVTLPPVAMQLLNAAPIISLATSGLTATALTRLIGRSAMRLYAGEAADSVDSGGGLQSSGTA